MPEKQRWMPMEIPPDISAEGIFIGTSGYYYDDWIGVFNPPKRSAGALRKASEEERQDQDRLVFYQKYFSFVEINHTFYQEPQPGHFADIERRSKAGMRFAVKVHRDISHTRVYDAAQGREIMRRYIGAVGPLAESGRFFSFLVQLEDHCSRSQARLDYLRFVCGEAVAAGLDAHIEFRHASWHAGPVLQALKDAGIGLCNTDLPPFPHAFPLKAYATSGKGYVRYSGRNLASWYPSKKPVTSSERIAARNARYDYEYDREELEAMVEKQLVLMRKTAGTAVAYNNHFQAKAIRNAIENIKMLSAAIGAAARDRS
jgi:uncharacterized protein YecE (DUF72 family)